MVGVAMSPAALINSQPELLVAKDAALKAGRHLVARTGADVLETKLDSKDLVTAVDRECQDIIEQTIAAAFPQHRLLGEESVAPGVDAAMQALSDMIVSTSEEWIWIIDPIDGTTNFVQGLPLCAVSIGITRSGKRVGAVVYDPFREELFCAWRGRGATLNGQPIRTSAVNDLGDAVLCACSPHSERSVGPALRSIQELMPRARSIRILGSGVLNFAWVACGRLSAYWEPELAPWDSAAGTLLIEEAGGRVSAMDGSPYSLLTVGVLGCASAIHADLLACLARADATSREESSSSGTILQ